MACGVDQTTYLLESLFVIIVDGYNYVGLFLIGFSNINITVYLKKSLKTVLKVFLDSLQVSMWNLPEL